jgi:hypothetical protein
MLGKMKAKLKMLKGLHKQMMCAMGDGDGDDEDAGKEALAELKEEAPKSVAKEDRSEDEDEDEDDGFKAFMKGKKPKLNGKAALIVATVKRRPMATGKAKKYG